MDLRQLAHFLAIRDEGGITAAARKLHLTQSALSRQMKALEAELETELLERGAHSVTLTPAGELLAAEGGKLLRFSEGMLAKVRALGEGEPLRVGYAPSLAGEFLGLAIERFTQLHPRVRVSLFDWSSAEMRAGLAAGKLELIVAAPSEALAGAIRWEPLRDYGWRVVVARNHPFAAGGAVAAERLAGQRLLLFDRAQYPDYWEKVTGFFRQQGMQAKVAGEFDGVSSLLAALEAGMGVALLAETTVVGTDPRSRLVSLPLEPAPRPITVAAGVPDDRPCLPRVLAFVEELKRAASEVDRA